ncbi:LysM peptidoglycan-binding domain-containing protein [Chryseobacterium sp. G0201]|uniref:LysM peptidoglycan-binding domain-containing protein n=1 Tax=Chryseobacterium sp. G0201 TaxID=2487065 RepID=UPI000F515FDD|nr:LysM peptidoglycan-binding domain-containing protein [Chryseobacterium sp. G0201]AZA54736.1 LysM peptidoglycan-binding domain-containing protein [Chryseobacterium sp. G0201]
MKLFLRHHIVKKGETLEQIAALYNVPSVEILKYYHYKNVPKDSNHIGHTLFEGQEIFVPESNDIEKILLERKQALENRLEHSNSLIKNSSLLPNFTGIDHTYKVKITDFNEGNIENETEFEIDIQYIGKDDQHHIFKFNKNSILINGEIPDMKAYELALNCSSILFSVELGIDFNGKMADIHNYRVILNKWKENKQRLLQKYEDENSRQYIDKVDIRIESKELLLENLSRELFIQFYFSPYFKTFSNGKAENTGRFSQYKILYENHYENNLEHEIHISQSSQSVDPRSQEEIIRYLENSYENSEDSELLESEISAHFILDKQYKFLQKADVKIDLYLYNTQETKQIQIDKK